MKKWVVITVVLVFSLVGSSILAEQKDEKCNALENCIVQYLEETNVIINGKISDPGGHKRKGATEHCQYEKSKSPKKFNKKYCKKDSTE